MSSQHDTTEETKIRETYEEFSVGETCLGKISDPENNNAWIQSDVVVEIEH